MIGINAKVPDHPARGGEARADGSRGRLQLDVEETDRVPIERNQLDAGIGVIGLRAKHVIVVGGVQKGENTQRSQASSSAGS